jgi:hypothetical protein
MSELKIDADIAGELDCEVGDTISVTVTGTVTSKAKDGSKVLNVTSVDDYEHGPSGEEYEEEKPMPKRKGMSGAMLMVKGK